MKLVALMSTLRRGACAVPIRPGLLVMIEHGDKVLPLRSSGRPLPATIHAWLHTSTQEAPAGSCRLHTLLQRRRRRAGIGLSTSLSTTARPAVARCPGAPFTCCARRLALARVRALEAHSRASRKRARD